MVTQAARGSAAAGLTLSASVITIAYNPDRRLFTAATLEARVVNTSEINASGWTLHPFDGPLVYATRPASPMATDLITPAAKRNAGTAFGMWNTATRSATRGHQPVLARDVTRKPMSRLPHEAPQQPARTRTSIADEGHDPAASLSSVVADPSVTPTVHAEDTSSQIIIETIAESAIQAMRRGPSGAATSRADT